MRVCVTLLTGTQISTKINIIAICDCSLCMLLGETALRVGGMRLHNYRT